MQGFEIAESRIESEFILNQGVILLTLRPFLAAVLPCVHTLCMYWSPVQTGFYSQPLFRRDRLSSFFALTKPRHPWIWVSCG